jgi:hypothetical protein
MSTSIQFFDLADRKTRQIAAIDKPVGVGLAVWPDGRTILYTG